MHTWLGRMPWAFGWLLCLGMAIAAPPRADQIRSWIGQLDSHDFTVYAKASRSLLDAGDTAVEALLTTASSGDAAAALRSTGVLEQIALHGNESTLRRVIAGLEELDRRGQAGLDGIVERLHTRQARLQRERAVATLRSMGGRFEGNEKILAPVISKSTAEAASSPNVPQLPPEVPANQTVAAAELPTAVGVGLIDEAYVSPEFLNGAESKEPELVLTIDEQWRGGDAGLAAILDLGSIVKLRLRKAPLTDAALEQVAAIPQLQSVELEGCHFSVEALDRLQRRHPQMQVIVQGK